MGSVMTGAGAGSLLPREGVGQKVLNLCNSWFPWVEYE